MAPAAVTAYSILLSCRLRGTRFLVVARDDLDTRNTSLATDDAGVIPAFVTEDDARHWAANRFPTPPADEFQTPELIAGMEGLYAEAGVAEYDLDAAARWAEAPSPGTAEPGQLLEAWVFLHWAGVAPPVDLSDMEGIAGGRELAGLAYLLSGMQRDFERTGKSRGLATAWPAGVPDLWPAEADAVLREILKTGLREFEQRLRVN